VRRPLLAIGLVVVAIATIWFFLIRDSVVAPAVAVPEPAATLEGEEGPLAVTGKGVVLVWFHLPEEPELPTLPPVEPPQSGRLGGPMLEQARVLGAAPSPLRPYLGRSFYGEGGVVIETTSGIELRFGDASQAAKKWKAAAAVLADPEIEALDYVNVNAPGRPSYGGSGHTLPPVP
jgi:hypothetical protein